VNGSVSAVVRAGQSLERVERLIDQVVEDLLGKGSSVPCSRCPDMLFQAHAELHSFAGSLAEPQLDQTALLPQLRVLLPRLSAAERLLAAAGEFYRGWCAAGPLPAHPLPGYQSNSFCHGPALLALEG